MICPECKGDCFTYDNPENQDLIPKFRNTKTYRCYKCNGTGKVVNVITIDKEMLAVALADEKAEDIGINTNNRYNSVKDNELWNEWYAHYVKMIEEQEV